MVIEAKQSSQKCTEDPEIAPIPSQGDRSTQILFHLVKDRPKGSHLVPHSSANVIITMVQNGHEHRHVEWSNANHIQGGAEFKNDDSFAPKCDLGSD